MFVSPKLIFVNRYLGLSQKTWLIYTQTQSYLKRVDMILYKIQSVNRSQQVVAEVG